MNLPPPPPDVPPEKLEELVRAMELMRNDLLQVSLLLHDYLYETDATRREQARQATEALIRQCRPG